MGSENITAVRIGKERVVLEEDTTVVPIELELAGSSTVELTLTVAAPPVMEVAQAPAVGASRLTLGQKVPAKPEGVASGAIFKPIKRTDAAFATLVRNDNSDIVFKNEEGTSADRMMTPKLKVKLDALAVLVKAEWAGTKLRVTEAWDEQGEHAAGSLHYEGRAADLTTAPLDNAKLGRLGRLAVDAGFDWVFYENAVHVHVSMKK